MKSTFDEAAAKAGDAPKLARYFWDTEFDETAPEGFAVDFISGALVADTGEEFYGVYEGVKPDTLSKPWLQENVISKLPPRGEWKSLEEIRRGILAVIKPAKEIEIWGKSPTTDAFILYRIFGGSQKLWEILKAEKGIERISIRDSNELRRQLHWPKLPQQPADERHIALFDARYERTEFHLMQEMLANPAPKRNSSLRNGQELTS